MIDVLGGRWKPVSSTALSSAPAFCSTPSNKNSLIIFEIDAQAFAVSDVIAARGVWSSTYN